MATSVRSRFALTFLFLGACGGGQSTGGTTGGTTTGGTTGGANLVPDSGTRAPDGGQTAVDAGKSAPDAGKSTPDAGATKTPHPDGGSPTYTAFTDGGITWAITNLTGWDGGPLNWALGSYFYPNPGPGGDPTFDQNFDTFSADMGMPPWFYNQYTDDTDGLANVGSSQVPSAQPLQNDPRFAPGKCLVVVGIPMASTDDLGDDSAIEARFEGIADGTYDAIYQSAVDAWAVANFKRVEFRLGYEMNGNWMPWAVPSGSGGPDKDAAFIAAFRHLSQLMKAEGVTDGIEVQITWNPCLINWMSEPTDNTWPGDDVVDIVDLDIYSTVNYASDFTNWSDCGPDGVPTGTAPDLTTWASSAVNRCHFWLYPDATSSDPTGANQPGWGLAKHLAFAAAHGKPVALSETGVGGTPGAPDDGLDDEGDLQQVEWEVLSVYPFGVDHVSVWTVDPNSFLPNANPPHPIAEAAWRKYFGDGQ